ncbi:hypothetical protein [Nostoc sp. 106C]|uniref:hypothetical protein n=1 Tax=Nostoc sp. 106C TaxID=1932667 RepID=UPI000A388A77|nr:hypothetical protein [Nostoc sp. 106C]OUL23803.1 hypothetical protein BV375_24935 [Nostoc sp. 106C]
MNLAIRQSVVRQFYSTELNKLYDLSDSFCNFFPECRIASVQLLTLSTDMTFNCVEIKRIEQDIPQSVAKTYNSHFWYSQYSLSNLYLVKIPVESSDSFALLIQGYVDDGWDNSGRFIEIFDQQGDFLGAGRCHNEGVEWLSRQLNGQDFYTPAPAWVGDEPGVQLASEPIWSTEFLSQYAVNIEHKGSVTRYMLPGED